MVPAEKSRQLLIMMTAQTILWIILMIVVVEFILERLLDYLNSRYWSDMLPAELAHIYDAEKYARSQQYLRVNHRFAQVTESFNFILVAAMLIFGGFGWIDHLVRQVTVNPILMALLFFGIIGLIADLLGTPFSVYATFVIEERFGFNKTTVRTFILDKIKGWLLGAVIGGGILALIVWIYGETGKWFWLAAWGVITLFTLFMALFYSNLIVPLFNRQKPLEAGPLRDAIEDFSDRVGFRLKDIYVIDGSKRSSKANAYFTGLGRKKRIVLYDTLISDHPREELVAVLAHEIGHYKKKHTLTGIATSIAQTGLVLFILSLFLDNPALSRALGAEEPGFHLGVLAFGVLYTPLAVVIGLVMNYISRRQEFQADGFAAAHGLGDALKNALIRLSVNNLSNLRPHPAYVFFHYSHPPLLQRLAAIRYLSGGSRSAK